MGYPDMMRDILAQARREVIANRRKALENLPIIDRLTGLYNRKYFELRLDEEMARSRQYGNILSLILIDTGLSLRQGSGNENAFSEKVMQVNAGIIGDCLENTIGLSFLYDEGKFAIILPEADGQEAALIAGNMRKAILREKMLGVKLQDSMVQYQNHDSIDEFIQAADDALRENNI